MKNSRVLMSIILVLMATFSGCSKEDPAAPAAPSDAAASSEPAPVSAVRPDAVPSVSDSASPAVPAASASAPAASALASADGEQSGLRVDVTELRRSSGGTLSLKFTMTNGSAGQAGFGYNYGEKNKGYGNISGVHLIDQAGKKKYFVATDSEGECVCSRGQKDLPAGEKRNLWAKFPAPPADVKQISIVIPHFSPMDDVPIAE